MSTYRKKLIEVSLPLEAINKASVREKSIRHGHPSTLHLWWARRPLAACRAVLFAQLVDDPSAWPDKFPTEDDQKRERERLYEVIKEIVSWEATNRELILDKARYEIALSLARGRNERPPQRGNSKDVLSWLAEHAPPICDPFCGGGSIPLEAQRFGLRAHGSDLNPVAVLISKATCEIPFQFAGYPPVNPDQDPLVTWKGAHGLAADIHWYGKWMRNEALSRIGHLYPKIRITESMTTTRPDLKPYINKKLTTIAWLWVRTVASPDPMLRGAHVPLVRSFVLSSKKNKRVWVKPVINSSGNGYHFVLQTGPGTPPNGTVDRSGGCCLLTGTPMPFAYLRAEGKAGRMGARLMAMVVEGSKGRVYLDPVNEMEKVAQSETPEWRPENEIPHNPSDLRPPLYGMRKYADLFTDRQLVALTTLSDLVLEAREKVLAAALVAGMDSNEPCLAQGGKGAEAYADAVATYLGLCVSRQANRSSNLSFWDPSGAKVQQVFARQALPMVWDFCESNPFSDSSGNFLGQVGYLVNVVKNGTATQAQAAVIQQDAAGNSPLVKTAVIATDPPYYDNIGYADLSDFFYIWQRRILRTIWPDLFRRVLTPKEEELVATPYRRNNKQEAEKFFMDGMSKALRNIHIFGADEFPITIYYAFKQTETTKQGVTSPGWATFLQSLVDTGYTIDGTWPVRTELPGALKKRKNALASSIVLVCRKRPTDAPTITRHEFAARLRAELPNALRRIREGGVGPVDMAQAALGPSMGIFTATSKVLEPDDTPMNVHAAIALINQVRDEISGEESMNYDPDTRFCIDWFQAFGMNSGKSGDAITMALAYGIGIGDLESAGVFTTKEGVARLLSREELPEDWDPATDKRLTDWECAQHLARVLKSSNGGIDAVARLYLKMPSQQGDAARMLAYRLYDICEQRKNLAEEAQVWNELVQEWPAVEAAVARIGKELLL